MKTYVNLELALTEEQFKAWDSIKQKQWLKDHPTSKFAKNNVVDLNSKRKPKQSPKAANDSDFKFKSNNFGKKLHSILKRSGAYDTATNAVLSIFGPLGKDIGRVLNTSDSIEKFVGNFLTKNGANISKSKFVFLLVAAENGNKIIKDEAVIWIGSTNKKDAKIKWQKSGKDFANRITKIKKGTIKIQRYDVINGKGRWKTINTIKIVENKRNGYDSDEI